MRGKAKQVWNRMIRKKFYIKLVMTTALIAIVPSLLADVVAFGKVSSTFKEETGQNKLQYLDQTMNAIEMILNRIKENSNLLAMNQSIQEFEQFPSGRYYENLDGPYNQKDLPALYSYLEAKKRSILTVNSFRLSNPFVDSVYFYDNSKNVILTSESEGSNRQYTREQFYDKGWYKLLADGLKTNAVFMDTRMAKQFTGEKNLLTIIYKTNKEKNAFVINLNAPKIYNEIMNKLNRGDDMYVVSSEGSVLFHGQPGSIHQPISQLVPGSTEIIGRTGSYQTEVSGSKKLVSYSTSALLGWTFVNISDMQALTKGTSSIKQTIFLSAFVLILITLMLVYLSSRSLYRPISMLKEMIGGDPERRQESLDEIGCIGKYVRSALHERDYYKEKLGESLPFHREQFKCSLLLHHQMTLEEINGKKAYLGVDLDPGELAVITIFWDSAEVACLVPDDKAAFTRHLQKLHLIDMAEQWLSNRMTGIVVDTGRDVIAVVISSEGLTQQLAFRLGQELMDDLSSELKVKVTAGIGSICVSILELPTGFEEALEALKYRMVYGEGEMISIEDVRIENQNGYTYPKQLEEALIGHIKMGRTEEALQIYEQIVSEINIHKGKLHYNQIQPLFMQLLTGIIHVYSQGGISDLYRELLELDGLEKINKWFRAVISSTTAGMERELSAKGHHHISRVIEMMEHDYAQDLSLQMAAEQLNLNPAYISRLFKQITGEPFVDYLKKIRIDKSKELLERSSLRINEIGKQVGYSNSYYFIKVFKDTMGITPGEYKKMYG